MAQKNIDFGSFPDDPSADAIRTAFQKTQENFDQLFQGLSGGTVLSINKTPGAGITVNAPTGDVIISANLAQLKIHTSTLSVGRDANGLQDTSITQSSQTLWIDLPQTISNVVNMNLTGNVSAVGNVTSANTLTGNITVTGTTSFNNLNVAGNISAVGNATISALSASSASITGLLQADNISTTGNANVGNLNVTGVITSIGNIIGGNITTNNYILRSVATGISANGSTQGTATLLNKEINVVSTVSTNEGVQLPSAIAGMVLTITNTSANDLLVYPMTSGTINSLSVDAAFTQLAGATIQFIAPTTTQWYTVGATN